MKKTKRFLAAMLAALTVLTATAAITASAETETTEPATETVELVGATEEPSTQPVTEPDTTAPVTEPATEAPTEAKPVVGSISNMHKTSYETNLISVAWNPAPGATGYALYLCKNESTSNFTKVTDTTATSYTFKNLTPTSAYQIRVIPYTVFKGERINGTVVTMQTGTQAAIVTGLGRVSSEVQPIISWQPVAGASGYKIYRGVHGAAETLYKTLSANTTSFKDTSTVKGKIYTYNVVAYKQLPNGAVYHSGSKRIQCLAGMHTANFSVYSEFYRGFLSWNKVFCATRYDVYYSTNPNAQTYTYVGSTTGTSMMTGKLPGCRTVYFRVYPIYKKTPDTPAVTGTTITKSVYVSDKMYGQTVYSTYIEVNIARQHMWFYKNNKLVVDTPVVTGNDDGECNTPYGYFSIYSRARNTVLYGPGYASPVDYWMAFCGGCGIHDASWRSSFGGTIYKGNGSHGCINTPYNAVRTIYNNSDYGTPVIVY